MFVVIAKIMTPKTIQAPNIPVSIILKLVVVQITEPDHRSTSWIEGFAIFVAVMISSVITTVNNYQK